jgi:hypothetical protein
MGHEKEDTMLKDILLGQATAPIEAVGKMLDSLFTSDKERLDKQVILSRLATQSEMVQAEINKIEAGQRTLFVAGWRPFIGWICGVGLAYNFILRDLMAWVFLLSDKVVTLPSLDIEALMTLLYALLGLGSLRTYEKVTGRSR